MFSNAQVFGRTGALAYTNLSKKAAEHNGSRRMDEELARSLMWWADHMGKAPHPEKLR